jgi:hypothetical protein
MGNRLEEGVCVRCGFPLIDLNNFLCSQCIPIVVEQVRKIKANPNNKGKRIKLPTKVGQQLPKNVVYDR